MIERKRIEFLDVAMALAILRVVSIHALNNYFILISGRPLTFHEMPGWGRLADLLLRFSVPVFVIVSGFKFALSESRHGPSGYFSYARKRIDRLLRPYIIWTILLYFLIPPVYGKIPVGATFQDFPCPSIQTIWNILNGADNPAYQLWFVPMLLLLTVFYPFIFRHVPAAISQPLLWCLFMGMRIWNIPIPWNYPSYLVFIDLGARLGMIYHKHGFPNRTLRPLTMLSAIFTGFFFLIQWRKLTFLPFEAGLIGAEIFLPLALIGSCAVVFSDSAPGKILTLSRSAWPIFILHEPVILAQIAWFTYITAGIRHPLAILPVVLATLLISEATYRLLKRSRLGSFLF